jgi:ubiquinone/menaquinone biosynthesis C-methylase UbiE
MSLPEKERILWDLRAEHLRADLNLTSKGKLVSDICKGDNWWEKTFAKVSDKKILDIGCGIGNYVAYWGLTQNEAYGIDISKGELLNAVITHKKLELDEKLVNSTIENLPFKDNSFDIAHIRWVIHHLSREKIASSLTEIKRVLRKDGYLFLYETNYLYPIRHLVQTPHLKKINLFRKLALDRDILDPEERALKNNDYLDLLEEVKFKIVKVDYHQGILWYLPKLFIFNKGINNALEKLDRYVSSNFVPQEFSISVMIIARKTD